MITPKAVVYGWNPKILEQEVCANGKKYLVVIGYLTGCRPIFARIYREDGIYLTGNAVESLYEYYEYFAPNEITKELADIVEGLAKRCKKLKAFI